MDEEESLGNTLFHLFGIICNYYIVLGIFTYYLLNISNLLHYTCVFRCKIRNSLPNGAYEVILLYCYF